MTDKKISELSSNGTLDGTELIPLVQSGGNVKALLSAIKTFIIDGLLRVQDLVAKESLRRRNGEHYQLLIYQSLIAVISLLQTLIQPTQC